MKINENWKLEYDENNVVLINHETKSREKINKDRKKTGEIEQYEWEDKFYYPTVQSALIGFYHKATKYASSIKDLIDRMEKAKKEIRSMVEKNELTTHL